MKKWLFSILALVLMIPALSAAAPEDFTVREMALFYKGNKVKGVSLNRADTVIDKKSGKNLLWAAVDARETLALKGAATGLYFFWAHAAPNENDNMKNAKGQFAGFMPLENPDQAFLGFSASGQHFYLSQGGSPFRDLSIHEFAGFKKIHSFKSMPEVAWSPDWDGRLVFTLIDEGKGERSPDWGLMAPGWMSVVVYDPKTNTTMAAAQASATADYMFEEIDSKTRQIVLTAFSVKNKAHWALVNAPEQTRHNVNFPPLHP